ncbi:MAG TPA: hypothetical protein VFE33_00735 [Thermoanaerobaculia bacterium]|nr:hypothetical protein [Thermoanaerobaculia bacterium]
MDRTEAKSQKHASPSLTALGIVYTALFATSLVLGRVMAGEPFPSPFGAEAAIVSYFQAHGDAVRIAALFQFGAAIPLGLFTATVVSRLQFLGVRAAGATIALFGGFAASFFLALSGLVQWVLARPEVAGNAALLRALQDLAFMTGGPGHVVPLGLLLAGVSVTAFFTRLLPRWVCGLGLVLAALAELSTLTLFVPVAAYLLPIARFPAFVWILATGVLLPRERLNPA